MNPHQQDGLDLAAYLDRIGHDGPVAADLATLRALQLAHITAVPFENLDAVRGVVPSLELADLQDKIVRRRRGGYCFEHNRLLAAALRAAGLAVRPVAARVVLGAERHGDRPRTHMTLLVGVPGEPLPFLADAGFGTVGAPLAPLPLTEGAEQTAGGRRHRLLRTAPVMDGLDTGDERAWVMQFHGADGWEDQYVFTTEPAMPVDQTVANWYVAAHPRSPFRERVFVQRTGEGVHRSLSGREYTVTREDGSVERRMLADEEEVRKVVATEMGLPADA
ncbi:arylamine N-acetyltransferase family protein [Streptomyces sp. MS19]|uniref:arylamine N-acetyltransferase family protein n=1 Tax=Streptomyces sp. MS19 TaxID=3385972 RepID=UPI0039A34177